MSESKGDIAINRMVGIMLIIAVMGPIVGASLGLSVRLFLWALGL